MFQSSIQERHSLLACVFQMQGLVRCGQDGHSLSECKHNLGVGLKLFMIAVRNSCMKLCSGFVLRDAGVLWGSPPHRLALSPWVIFLCRMYGSWPSALRGG